MISVTLLTPRGRGAIAVLSVTGAGALELVASCFHPAGARRLAARPLDRVCFGRWLHRAGEEVIVVRTDSESLEIHCHGGEAASRAVIDSLVERGARAVPIDEPPTRDRTPLSADAWRMLAEAPTERVAGLLLDQSSGVLEREIERIDSFIYSGEADRADEAIGALMRGGGLADRLLKPWRVVLAGPPNAGKSSLINALVGYERAIVFDRPGTTRDVVSAITALDGWPFELSDTAGLRETADPIERAGVRLAHETIAAADVTVLVLEASGKNARQADQLRAEIQTRSPGALLEVASKADLAPETAIPEGAILTSVVEQRGVRQLALAIVGALRIVAPGPGQPALFRGWHVGALASARESLRVGASLDARNRLRAMLAGESGKC